MQKCDWIDFINEHSARVEREMHHDGKPVYSNSADRHFSTSWPLPMWVVVESRRGERDKMHKEFTTTFDEGNFGGAVWERFKEEGKHCDLLSNMIKDIIVTTMKRIKQNMRVKRKCTNNLPEYFKKESFGSMRNSLKGRKLMWPFEWHDKWQK